MESNKSLLRDLYNFGHGNVVGLGQALEEDAGELEVYQGRNEQGMAMRLLLQNKTQKTNYGMYFCWSWISEYDYPQRLLQTIFPFYYSQVMYLQRDNPDPVLQQIEQTHDLSISTNDAFVQ